MTRWDWICAALCAAWLAALASLAGSTAVTIRVDAASLDAIVGAAAIVFSSLFAIAVPLIIRRMDAGDARQDALDAALDAGRWAFALVAASQRFGIMPPMLDQGLRVQVSMAEQRVAGINLTSLRSISAARRVRQVQRLARTMIDIMPEPGALDPGAGDRFTRTATGMADAIRSLAQIVERRPAITLREVMERLEVV